MNRPSLVWFRRDLRLADQPALQAAIARGEPVIPVYILSTEQSNGWSPGAASRWWLHQSLCRLNEQLMSIGLKLIVRRGDTRTELLSLVEETEAAALFWTRLYEPANIERDKRIKEELRTRGIHVESFNGQLLFEPWQVQTKQDRPFQVFTAFWKSCLSRPQPDLPDPAPERIRPPEKWPQSLSIEQLKLEPKIRWDSGFKSTWQPGEQSARTELLRFLQSTVIDYDTARDHPSLRGTSRLSPHLHFGEISPRTVWHETQRVRQELSANHAAVGADTFLKELGWREFAYHLLFHFPSTTTQPLRAEFARFPWRDDPEGLLAWQRGQTGYPIVDAGMRELWATGWMHNRVRIITASFLVKDLLVPWQRGAEWFWDTLVDADLASNTLGWQWTAGCGADAAPYFRVFNPTLQSEKFDPSGEYLSRWLPELKTLPLPWLHAPWTAPAHILKQAGVRLGKTYPLPIVDHHEARQRALQSLAQLKSTTD